MRVLFIDSRLPYPPIRGDKLRVFNLLRRVARHHEVALITLIQKQEESKFVSDLRPYCSEIRTVYKPVFSSLFSCGVAVFDDIPFQVAYFRSRRMMRLVKEMIAEWKPDVVHTHYIRAAQYAADVSSVPRVLDLTDSFSLYLERLRAFTSNPFKRLFINLEYRRLRSYEPIIENFDRNLMCSPIDREQVLRQAPHARIDLLYNGVDLDVFTHDERTQPEEYRIILTGNMSYFPNTDAAVYFVREIFPIIQKTIPSARLYVVGQRPPKNVRQLASEAITVTGLVPDIAHEYMKSSVAVAPTRFGSGTLNKVIEALALGVPVVATTIGTSGLSALRDGQEILVADDPRQFAEHVIRLLSDPPLRTRLAQAGSAYVRSHLSWDVLAEQLQSVYADVAER
jgi:sugar transferase (PEP-CTERM/EpsH1 system associated)